MQPGALPWQRALQGSRQFVGWRDNFARKRKKKQCKKSTVTSAAVARLQPLYVRPRALLRRLSRCVSVKTSRHPTVFLSVTCTVTRVTIPHPMRLRAPGLPQASANAPTPPQPLSSCVDAFLLRSSAVFIISYYDCKFDS